MPNRAEDWLRQAGWDLEQAASSAGIGRHEWACFAAHQAAENAVKALHQHLWQESWGHVVRRSLEELAADLVVPNELIHAARVLDGYYVPTRYPNGHPAGAPGEHYGKPQAEEAIAHAGPIAEFCRLQMAKP